jgi:hypothetical protein
MLIERIRQAMLTPPGDPALDPRYTSANAPLYAGVERRSVARARGKLVGKLVAGDGFLSPDCLITELSPRGARVRIAVTIKLPPPAALLLVDAGLLLDADIAWRHGEETGLVFTGRHDLRSGGDPARPGLRDLWQELRPRPG